MYLDYQSISGTKRPWFGFLAGMKRRGRKVREPPLLIDSKDFVVM